MQGLGVVDGMAIVKASVPELTNAEVNEEKESQERSPLWGKPG